MSFWPFACGLFVGVAIGAGVTVKITSGAWVDFLKEAEAKGRITIRR